jgi:hypothetical protein
VNVRYVLSPEKPKELIVNVGYVLSLWEFWYKNY